MTHNTIVMTLFGLFGVLIIALNVYDRPRLWAWLANRRRTQRLWQRAGFTMAHGRMLVTPPQRPTSKQKHQA